jgi:hypothetical protein
MKPPTDPGEAGRIRLPHRKRAGATTGRASNVVVPLGIPVGWAAVGHVAHKVLQVDRHIRVLVPAFGYRVRQLTGFPVATIGNRVYDL